jgi:hypothetical protein
MENIDEIKVSIMRKFEEMLDAGLVSIQEGGKFSSSEIGKEIGKFINQEVKEIRKLINQEVKEIRKPRGGSCSGCGGRKKQHELLIKINEKIKGEEKVKAPRKKQKKDDSEEKPEKKRVPSVWNIYCKIKSYALKLEYEEIGIEKSPEEIMADIALLWEEDKADFISFFR